MVSFCLNGQDVSIDILPGARVSDVLRNNLGMRGTKIGCDAGDCGACTVLIDGKMACSCLTAIAQIEHCSVITVEGLAQNNEMSELQTAFLNYGAAQCGICTPGMLVAAHALLVTNPKPSRKDVEVGLSGVLCRCTGYSKIIDAVMHVSGMTMACAELPPIGASVGKPINRLDGKPKVLGTDKFGADVIPADAVFVRVIRSPYHHAHFEIGDVKVFLEAHPGLLAVFSANDIPGENCHGVIPQFADQPVFAEEKVRYRGEAIAAVVGEREIIHAFDPLSFPVVWKPLAYNLAASDALKLGAPQLHQSRDWNVLTEGYVQSGNLDAGFSEAEHIVEGRFSTPFIEHGYIEPEAGYAIRRGHRLEIYGCTQAPMMDREAMAAIMGMDERHIRVVPSACGGGFGSKLDLSFQPFVALAAWHLNHPAAIIYSRTESMQSTTKRHPADMSLRVGCSKDGKITAVDFNGIFNTGAYASWGPTVANRVPVHASGPYFTPNFRARSKAVMTNCAPAGAFRGFGVPQTMVALEGVYDEIAEKAGIDRLEFRLTNALSNGQPTVTGQVFEQGVGIRECLKALRPTWRRALDAANEHNKSTNGTVIRRGVGIASCWYGCGNTSLPNPSTIRIGITARGQTVLHQGATDIGQGSNTVIAQISADALGIDVHKLILLGPDTDLTPDAGKTSASRQTYVTGMAAKRAGETLRRQILRRVNMSETAKFIFGFGEITVSDPDSRAIIKLQGLEENEFGYVLMAEESYDPPTEPLDENGQGNPYAVYGYGAQLVELSVDMVLGTVKLIQITAAHDVGRAINPQLVEGQIEGGIAQGIGMALMENYVPGQTENLHDYLIPSIGDVPKIVPIIVEVEEAQGPFGAKGLGEHVLIPTAPAILNAIHHATDAFIRDLPATPDKVRAAILVAGK